MNIMLIWLSKLFATHNKLEEISSNYIYKITPAEQVSNVQMRPNKLLIIGKKCVKEPVVLFCVLHISTTFIIK